MNHKLESRLLGEISTTTDTQMIQWRETEVPLDEGERGEWKSWLKTQHSKTKIMAYSPWLHGKMKVEKWKQWQVLFSWAPKSLQMVTQFSSVQFSSVIQSCPTLCNPMDCSTPGLPVHHQLLEFTKTHVQWVSDAIQPPHPLLSLLLLPSIFPSIRVFSNESVLPHQVAKVLEFQL